MGGHHRTHAREVAFDVGPLKTLTGFLHRDDDAPAGLWPIEQELAAPNEGALLPIGVDPESVATDGDFLSLTA
jgi:hypothetical protein